MKRLFDMEHGPADDAQQQESRDLKNRMKDEVDDSEYAAYLFLSALEYVNHDRPKARYAQFDPDVRASDMGRTMERLIRTWRALQPGAEAPCFTVTGSDGRPVILSDYKDKYTLIFCWRLCPTTFEVQPWTVPIPSSRRIILWKRDTISGTPPC